MAAKKKKTKTASSQVSESAFQSILKEDRELQATMNWAAVTIETLTKAMNDQMNQSRYTKTVLNLAIERARQRANKALVEYDEAMSELSRLTADSC